MKCYALTSDNGHTEQTSYMRCSAGYLMQGFENQTDDENVWFEKDPV